MQKCGGGRGGVRASAKSSTEGGPVEMLYYYLDVLGRVDGSPTNRSRISLAVEKSLSSGLHYRVPR